MPDLRTLVRTAPLADLTDQEATDALNRRDQPGDVTLGELNQEIDNMVDANGIPAWEKIEAGAVLTAPEQLPLAVACRAALRLLRDSRPDYPGVNTRSATFSRNIDALVAGGALSSTQGNLLKGKSDNRRSLAEINGLGRVRVGHIEQARAV